MSDRPLKLWLDREGRLLRLCLARSKANIIDAQMIAALEAAFRDHLGNSALKGVLLAAEGPHFSFGASIQEHMPAHCRQMLESLHSLLKRMLDFPVPILVAVQGQCLGGGLELALAGGLIFAARDARMGQPEIRIGVFAPAASCLLPARIGQARAEDLLYSGRSVGADEALTINLVHAVAEDPVAAALAYFDAHLAPLSASSLRLAVRAARKDYAPRVKGQLDVVEALYLEELMATHDAMEGLMAFAEKRAANWHDR